MLIAGTLAVPAFAKDKKPVPVPNAPTAMTYGSLRAVRYCEVWLFTGTPETGLAAVYYNTSDLNNGVNRMDTCPPAMWAKVDPKGLEADYEILMAYKNGPRGWTMDSITLPVGGVETFDGVQARWMGEGKLPKGMKFEGAPPAYHPVESHRNSSMTFQKGKPAFMLEDPEGTPYLMQAFSMIKDPSLTYDGLKDLGARLKLAPGWKYRVATLDKDLTVSTPKDYAWVVFDELGNAYDGCKDGACNYRP